MSPEMRECVFSSKGWDLGGVLPSQEAAEGSMVGPGGTVLSRGTLVPERARPEAISRKRCKAGTPAAAERLHPKNTKATTVP